MNALGRKQYIIKKLQAEDYVDISQLAAELEVSSMTIRRDLNAMSDDGLITLQHGGAILNSGSLFEFNMLMKQENRMPEKMRIAEKCLSYVNEGDSIYLDAGTTVSCLAPLLKEKKNIIIMTHSLLAINQLANAENIRLIMCPGEYRFDSLAFLGALTNEFIAQFKIDTFFFGVEGIDIKNGFTVPHISDGTTKRALIQRSQRVICMADSTKFNTSYYYGIAPLSHADLIVTDSELNPDISKDYAKADITVVTA